MEGRGGGLQNCKTGMATLGWRDNSESPSHAVPVCETTAVVVYTRMGTGVRPLGARGKCGCGMP